ALPDIARRRWYPAARCVRRRRESHERAAPSTEYFQIEEIRRRERCHVCDIRRTHGLVLPPHAPAPGRTRLQRARGRRVIDADQCSLADHLAICRANLRATGSAAADDCRSVCGGSWYAAVHS